MNTSASNGPKSFKDALLTPIRRTYEEWQLLYPKHLVVINEDETIELLSLHGDETDFDDLPDLIDENDNVVNSDVKPTLSIQKRPVRRHKKPKQRKGPREVKNFIFTTEELQQQAEFNAAQELQRQSSSENARRFKMTRVFVEEISDSDSDDGIAISVRAKIAEKNRRKRANRALARESAATAVKSFERLLSKFIEVQSPKIVNPVVRENIIAMEAIGMPKSAIEYVVRHYDCSARKFSTKRLKRFKREDIQREKAKEEAAAFSRAFYSEKLRHLNRDAARQLKHDVEQ